MTDQVPNSEHVPVIANSWIESLKNNIMFSFMFDYVKKFYVIRIILHEYSHLIALRWMGYTGVIKSFNLDSVYPLEYASMTTRELQLFYAAGGLGELCFGMYGLLFTSKTDEDRLIDIMIIIHGFVYGYTEAFMPKMWWSTGASLGFLGGWMFLALCIVKKSIEISRSQS